MQSLTIQRAVFILLILFSFFSPTYAKAADFEIFDGRVYNGKFYPRIDIIEWGTPSHMEFHIYSKGKPIELGFELEDKTGRKVMLVNYHITERGERLCRRVLAPAHFHSGFMVYVDKTDPDFDNVIVSVHELPAKRGLVKLIRPHSYAACELDKPDRSVASTGEGEYKNIAPPHVDQSKTKVDGSAIKKPGQAVPFGDIF
ncbi:MAG TPA: hypothetical protein PLH57_00465 [Oligoflexia bacterium]|nr:hypothetical protein [Oligoflexia bacterium]